MQIFNSNKPARQSGAAVLVTSVILLIGVTLIVIFATRVGVLDQRISGNEYRHKEAFARAEAGVDQAASFLRVNPVLHEGNAADGWESCVAIFPCDQVAGAEMVYANLVGGIFQPKLPVVTSNTEAYLVKTATQIVAIGRGVSDDNSGQAVAQVAYAQSNLITPGEIPPVMAPELNLNGAFTIVANPNNGPGTTGVPISGWASSNDSGTGTWQTCNAGEYRDGTQVCTDVYTSGDDWSGCQCTEVLSDSGNINYDIYIQPTDPDPSIGFPDPFEYVFGTGATVDNIQPRFEDEGKYYPGDCTGLDTLDLSSLSKPWVWVEGDCNIPSIGTATLPVVLVVEGTATLNANTDVWGLVVSVTEVKSNGAAFVHGSLVADGTADIANGGYTQVYDESVLNALAGDEINTSIGKIKYSWRDF